ncbi:MAG TPA: tetratricopeptide repeat protein, partial [Gammaproteobacteria bacterium]|nr:tetratricopeptide repeat protein [Gammaproteobacteria bacterium]
AINAAIEALNAGKYPEAHAAIAGLKLDKLSPYERGKIEWILFNIAYAQDNYSEAREHLESAIRSGGLNEQEISQFEYQRAQLYMAEDRWKEGAAALEEWFKTAQNPNSAAHYMLAMAYYQLEEFDRALPHAKQAVELMEKPQESWIGLLLALYVQRERFQDAVPLLQQLIELASDNKAYWLQLSGVYGQLDDYANALAVMQLAYGAGLLSKDAEIRRLADLLLLNGIPYRCGQVLEAAIEGHTVNLDDKLYDKLANCWIAAGELDKALPPLAHAAELSVSGDAFVRLAEVHVQRADWAAAQAALERGLGKGQLKDAANTHLLMGIALYNEHKLADARPWFERAQASERYRQTAKSYLQLIASQLDVPRRVD